MASKRGRDQRQARRLNEAGINLAVVGGLFVLLPRVVNESPLGKALHSLEVFGWLLLLAGAALLLVGRHAIKAAGPARVPDASSMWSPDSRISELSAEASGPESVFNADDWRDSVLAPTGRIRPERWGKDVFDVIEWRRFEAVVERLFRQAGFETTLQSRGANGGVDLWIYSRHQPGHPVSLLQCQHGRGKSVDADKVRELRAAMAARKVKRGQFASTSTFTPDALAAARDSGINLLGVDVLLNLIGKRSPEQQAELLAVALDGDYWRPTCVDCGVKMVGRRRRKNGQAVWRCGNTPRCRTTMPMINV